MEKEIVKENKNIGKDDKYKYLIGFNNYFESEAIEGSLIRGCNNPQKCPMDLYAEQINGTSFTQPRHLNLRSWMYKIKPTVGHSKHVDVSDKFPNFISDFADGSNKDLIVTPDQLRWKPIPLKKEDEKVCFLQGITTYCGAGEPGMKAGIAIHSYSCNISMDVNSAFYSADGDFLIVPQLGDLDITTEMGKLYVTPYEFVVIPRGIKFNVSVSGSSRGYICELYRGHFRPIERGPIGSNGMANERDFCAPTAWYENRECKFTVYSKFLGKIFTSEYDRSVFDTVAWHGNYVPFKYNLKYYNTMGTITFDHPDPSIFTVLSAASDDPYTSVCDFVIFNPRWLVGEDTFRPPYYHRNTMTEFMGNIDGVYDAKEQGFSSGAASLHSCMSGHGPEYSVFEKGSKSELKPQKLENTLSFMFETCFIMKVNKKSFEFKDEEYIDCWKGFKNLFIEHEKSKK